MSFAKWFVVYALILGPLFFVSAANAGAEAATNASVNYTDVRGNLTEAEQAVMANISAGEVRGVDGVTDAAYDASGITLFVQFMFGVTEAGVEYGYQHPRRVGWLNHVYSWIFFAIGVNATWKAWRGVEHVRRYGL